MKSAAPARNTLHPCVDPETPPPQAEGARQEADADHRRPIALAHRFGSSKPLAYRLSPAASGLVGIPLAHDWRIAAPRQRPTPSRYWKSPSWTWGAAGTT